MKLFHSLRFRFAFIFSVFIVVLSVSLSLLGIRQTTKAASEVFSAQGIAIVEKAVSIVNGDSFDTLVKSLDKNDPFYEETRIKLLEIKELSGCLYLYTMSQVEGDTWQYIIDGSSEPDDEDNFSEIGDKEDTSDYDGAFRRVMISGKTECSELVDQGEWGWIVSIYSPIKNSSGKVVGIAGCDFNGTSLHNSIVLEIKQQSIIGGISIIIGIALAVFFMRMIFTPINNINAILKEISLGEGDLTKRINIHRNDEIQELATYFNMTLDKIRNLIVVIKGETSNLHSVGGNLASNMQETVGAIHHITAHIEAIKQKITSQSASVSQTGATMNNVTANIDKLDKNVEAQTESVSMSSSAIEEMLASIENVTQTLGRNAQSVQELIKVSDHGRTSLQKVTQDIQEIAKESEGLMQINSVMENISSQTNLLSMNAAIEAAHAGEAGKGFAVVAGEIRKLAESAAQQSKTISDVLKKIKISIETITGSTNTALDNFNDVDEKVRAVSEQETNIYTAMEEQGRGSKQIHEAVSKLKELTQMVKRGSTEMLDGSKEVIMESRNLEKVTVEISTDMNEIVNGAEKINSSVSQVEVISKTNKDCIDTLFSEVSKFKVN
ncbi:methyl-accepting chemotaxis protein [Treponema sp. R80B11-R83G3]